MSRIRLISKTINKIVDNFEKRILKRISDETWVDLETGDLEIIKSTGDLSEENISSLNDNLIGKPIISRQYQRSSDGEIFSQVIAIGKVTKIDVDCIGFSKTNGGLIRIWADEIIYYSTRNFFPQNDAIKEHNSSRKNYWYLGPYVREVVELHEEEYQEIINHESINTERLNNYE